MGWVRSEPGVALRRQEGSEELGDCLVQASEIKGAMMSGAAMMERREWGMGGCLAQAFPRQDRQGRLQEACQNCTRQMAAQPSLDHSVCLQMSSSLHGWLVGVMEAFPLRS